jgi:hypothetical protein
MSKAALLLVLTALLSGCDSTSSQRANVPTTTTARECFFEVVSTVPVDVWPEHGQDCVSGLIEEDFNGTEAVIRCGRLQGYRASCHATWTDVDNAYCAGTFKLHVYGPYVEISDGIPVICSIL